MRRRLWWPAKKFVLEVVRGAVVPSNLLPISWRWRVLRVLGLEVEKCRISPGVFLGGRDIAIGPGVVLNRNVFIDGTARVEIHAHVGMAPRVQILTSTHAIGPSHRRLGKKAGLPVVIEDGVWLGAGVTVLPGVTVGRGCVVAAGSVVTKDCEHDTLYAGVPARRVRQLDDEGDLMERSGATG